MQPKIDSCATKGSIWFRVLHDPSTNRSPSLTLVPPTERPKGNGAKTQRAGDLEGRLRGNPWAMLRRVRTCFAAVSEGDCPLRMRAHTCNCHSCRSLPLQRYPINYGRGFRTARASLWLSLSISYEAERQLKKDKFQFFLPNLEAWVLLLLLSWPFDRYLFVSHQLDWWHVILITIYVEHLQGTLVPFCPKSELAAFIVEQFLPSRK